MSEQRQIISATGILLFFGLLYAFIVPPFQAPDEPAHFARAYGIAEGQFILKDHPRALIEYMLFTLGQHYDLSKIPIFVDIKAILDSSCERVPNIAYNTSQYSFIPYLFHALVIKSVMIFVEHPKEIAASLYICRVLTLLLFCMIFYAAASLAKPFLWLIFWVAATPMALSQSAVFSTDVFVLGCGILLIALGVSSRLSWNTASIIGFPAVFLLLVSKPPYFPVSFGLFYHLLANIRKNWPAAITLTISTFLGLIVAYVWKNIVMDGGIYDHTMSYIHHYRSAKIIPAEQLSYIINNPLSFLLVIWNTMIGHGFELYRQMVGVLGWQDLAIPWPAVAGWSVLLPAAVIWTSMAIDNDDKSLTCGFIYLFSGVLTAVAVLAALYMVWMPVGAATIEAQGRYFLLSALAMAFGVSILLSKIRIKFERWCILWVMITASVLLHIASLTKVVQRYGIIFFD